MVATASVALEIRLASVPWAPFSDQPGQPRVAIALVYEALSRSGYEVKTTILPDGSLTPVLRDGGYDGSPAIWRDSEREDFLLFSHPILENRLVVVGRKGTNVRALSLGELEGARIALVAGYSYGEAVSSATGPVFVEGEDHQQNLERLLSGEVDYMLIDELVIQAVLQHQSDEAEKFLEIGTVAMVRRPLHFAVRKDFPGAERLVARFDEEIQAMLRDGTYNRLLGLNWIRADADGDGHLELILGGDAAGTKPPTGGYEIPARPGGDRKFVAFPERYWIDGQAYSDWDQVPERYKVYDPVGTGETRTASTWFKLRF
jgi:ABC-type amino acid transport substrate-binding protein